MCILEKKWAEDAKKGKKNEEDDMEDLDDDALLGELEEMDTEGLNRGRVQVEELLVLVTAEKKCALQEKKAGDNAKALQHLR
jgi:hypothetical protein